MTPPVAAPMSGLNFRRPFFIITKNGIFYSNHARDEDNQEDDEEDNVDKELMTTGKRVRNKKKVKHSKCPYCYRKFTNLKHHINQQHSQVSHKQEITIVVVSFMHVSNKQDEITV